jgi:hypothetical protein
MRKICFAMLLVPALAWGQPPPQTASGWYREGENQYVLGNYDKAAEAFKQGFQLETDESKKPAYLYNVAQAYRQANDCKNALFFYRRFIALTDAPGGRPITPKRRKDVMDWINELEVCVQQAAAVGKKPPTTNLPPDGDKAGQSTGEAEHDGQKEPAKKNVASAGGDGGGDREDRGDEEPKIRQVAPREHMISLRATGGGTKVSAGKFDVPVQVKVALVAGYPIAINDKLTIDAGVAVTLTPLPYDTKPDMPTGSKTALLSAVMANGGVSYEVIPRLRVRGDVGIGGLLMSNVSMSQFTDFRVADGALSMFHVRVAGSGDYAFTPNWFGTGVVAGTYSPAKKGLETSIKSISSIDFMLGIGYRM